MSANARQLQQPPLETRHGEEYIRSVLRDVAILSDIRHSDEALNKLSGIMTERLYPAGAAVIEEGTEGTELFILLEGQVSVYKRTPGGDEYKVAIFDSSKNMVFGESGLIESEQRSASIRADVECRCLVLGRAAFEQFGQDCPQWALPIFRRIAIGILGRLRKTNNDMLLLYNALVDEIRGR
jgi:CRP/FNR family cyclic AMP-dependent transcriptional regulator